MIALQPQFQENFFIQKNLLRRPAPGHCLCNGRNLGRRLLPVTAACNARPLSVTTAAIAAARFLQRPPPSPPPAFCDGRFLSRPPFYIWLPPPLPLAFCDGRRPYRRPFPLFPLGATAPVLRPALFCGPLFTVDVESPHRVLLIGQLSSSPCTTSTTQHAAALHLLSLPYLT
jgi:hypothetical protein